MARSKPVKQEIPFKGFVQRELTAEEKQHLKSQKFALGEVDDTLVKLSEAGYKVTFKYDAFHKCYTSFMMSEDPKSENAGWILPGRGSTPVKALKQLAYLHFHLLGELWGANASAYEELDD